MASTSTSTSTCDSKKMIKLRSSDGVEFEMEEGVAVQSKTIKNMVEDGCTENGIPVPNVNAKIMAKVVEYCNKHAEKGPSEEELKAWDAEFVNELEQSTLLDLMLAANYLNIDTLLDLTCQTTANMIKDKSVEDVRKIFNIVNDFTPEEEKAIRNEHRWAFESNN